MYAALTVDNSNHQFTFKTLFTEENLLKIMSNKAASPQLAALYSPNQRSVSIRKNKEDSTKNNTLSVSPKDKLSALIFDSLESIIQGKVNIIFIPDGYLNRISFAALHMNNQFLFQQYNLKQLSASRILFNKPDTSKKNNFLLAGGINYGAENCTIKNRFLAQNISWNYLPGSLKEINALYKNVSGKVNTTFISNNNLTDTFNLSQYNYIHFATHGFYLDTADVNIYFDKANYQIDNIKKMPLLRSGIVLSNANCPNQKNTRENGYLLGYELAAQDLTQCKLITLSACESALGDIKSNLGVMGLQRAIKLAGAQKMLITLWKIPDTETAEFMQLFYNYFFIKKYSAEEALKNTQLVMSKKYAVSKWGAFVLIQ
jgi:CHAT domain-containing protein